MGSLLQRSVATSGFSNSAGKTLKRNGFSLGDSIEEEQDPTNAVTVPVNTAISHHRWSPYKIAGGTVAAVAGKGYCVIASDTRFAPQGHFSLDARNVTRVIKLTRTAILATAGMQAEAASLHKTLRARLVTYEHDHGKEMSLSAVAQMLSNILYYKRFFPYYASNVLGGLDNNGEGCAYSFDYVGSFERVSTACVGTGMQLMQPVLDNQIDCKQQYGRAKMECSLEEAVDTVKDAFSSAGERDIYTGDAVEIFIVTGDGISEEKFELKKD